MGRTLTELRIPWLQRAWQTKTSLRVSMQHQTWMTWWSVYCAGSSKNKNRRAAIARATVPRRVVAADRYSEIVTNRVLPPKGISVILLPSLTNAEYFALAVSSFHCTGASATTFPFIESRTWVSSADTA